ncbi:putative tryptophan transport protein [Planococcus massiliensis]|uniref:Putative tryptophan transport protein n=1 Tax=Planococcus massiliensis TaxID=1499687 RepID=A0A098ENW1_9BACL|nr:tryptophan transporter [Planococcus massiliensis]CEG23490.1 putative tryptophan transport protein [Planococcus massiliensis]
MNTKNLVLMALLVSVGAALYVIIPGFSGGMKPDFMLTMMFIGILLFPNVKSVFLLAVTTGVISGLFSTFPGGFVPNILDKFITAFVFLAFVLILKKIVQKLPVAIALCVGGTVLSGTVFLSSAIFVIGADIPFGILFTTVVLPAMLLNGVAFAFIYPIVLTLVRRSKFETAATQSA